MHKAMIVRVGNGIEEVMIERLLGQGVEVVAYSGSERKLAKLRERHADSSLLQTVKGAAGDEGGLLAAARGADAIFCCVYVAYDEREERVERMLNALNYVSGTLNIPLVLLEGTYRFLARKPFRFSSPDRVLRLAAPELYGETAADTVIHYYLKKIAKGEKPDVIGNPQAARGYLYLGDAAEYAIELAREESSYGKTWLLPAGAPLTLAEFGERAAAAAGSGSRPSSLSPWKRRLLGWAMPEMRELLIRYELAGVEQESPTEFRGRPLRTDYSEGIVRTMEGLSRRYR
ncbi:hypothetical protein [Cohnella thailandensis]|uniref:NAD(P)-binding domain-containing protein n=1 Tax=Cohnella thailandensis TaxID=557557 RepID=A0A841SM80_9BACL|nr:hypothetical protein [Cohnella thailandensis]MBB6633034.1 hypothetical protein [Cohnella thailandensis]MBP1975271.1 nucleoside-diphosphate-sugar epimerase [Cohnella thailandensis]